MSADDIGLPAHPPLLGPFLRRPGFQPDVHPARTAKLRPSRCRDAVIGNRNLCVSQDGSENGLRATAQYLPISAFSYPSIFAQSATDGGQFPATCLALSPRQRYSTCQCATESGFGPFALWFTLESHRVRLGE
jgi:hypothetical protein